MEKLLNKNKFDSLITGLKKQGYKPGAFWKFCEQRGLSEVDKVISKKDFFEVLDRFNE